MIAVDGATRDGISVVVATAAGTPDTVTATTISTMTTTTFDPVLNVPSLVTFLFIAVAFSALIVRTNQVEDAVRGRKERLQALRMLKSRKLAGDDAISAIQIEEALKLYERAVRNEEALRNIPVPGGRAEVRIIPPSAGDAREEEARLIAKQFLGQDFDIGVPKREVDATGKLPTAAVAVLAVLALSQVSLFAFLTFDPMGAKSWLENL
jgi:hypothetical protein